MTKANSLRPFERIRKNSEFRQILEKGERVETDNLRFYFTENNLGFSRIGLSLGKKTEISLQKIEIVFNKALSKSKTVLVDNF